VSCILLAGLGPRLKPQKATYPLLNTVRFAIGVHSFLWQESSACNLCDAARFCLRYTQSLFDCYHVFEYEFRMNVHTEFYAHSLHKSRCEYETINK